jgi:dipeptidyl aminopeptidase/acylaminoacyl peptidase
MAIGSRRRSRLNFEKEKAADSQRMFEALQENKIKSNFITLPGAGHGFRDADAQKAQAALVAWFEETLKKQ